ncbi:MAG: acyl-CoA dehydrogenase family protein, partial [Actinomycetota bacterium]
MQPELAYELFGGEEEEFRRAVRAFVDKELAGHAEEWEEAEAFPREVIARAGELGFLGLKYPEKYGGAAEDGREAKGWLADAVFTEELAGCGSGGLAASVQAHKDLFCLYVYSYGSEEQRRRWLVPAVDGKLVGALAVDEPATGPEVGTIETRAARQADGWTLNGTKALVTNGAWCDAAVVVAKTEAAPGRAGLSLFVVDADTPGFSARKVRTLGCRTAQTAELSFRDCRVPDACLLGEVGRGHDYLEANSAWERLVVALEEVARVERTYRSAKEYASTRE